MHHSRLVIRFHAYTHAWHHLGSEAFMSLFLAVFIFIVPASAAMRFQERSLYMNSSVPGATTSYKVSFRYMSLQTVGSVDMLFCVDPIPYHPCVTPPGLDTSNAVLSSQSGETGYSILSKNTDHVILTRSPSLITTGGSSYTLDGIVNPTDTSQSFSIRLQSFSTADATGPQIDFGSVKGEVTDGVIIETQVPPMLIFCVAGEVQDDCADTNQTNYSDMGQLDAQSTLLAQSQMAVGTNATGGFAITANGNPMAAGTNTIDSPLTPTQSIQGSNQFGLNLVANSDPAVGDDPEGTWANAIPSSDYSVPNRYKYVSGDTVAYSPNVSLMKKFTVSYIVNSSKDLRAGVYSTTITYIASGRF
ncbi:MAG: hypothetical protein JWP06_1023 [Candidatus Saccharibacteria bacterium]|nr:hypothetical protein [Candidatus Saccharibacteria bacterium]